MSNSDAKSIVEKVDSFFANLWITLAVVTVYPILILCAIGVKYTGIGATIAVAVLPVSVWQLHAFKDSSPIIASSVFMIGAIISVPLFVGAVIRISPNGKDERKQLLAIFDDEAK